jgi:hypothetical protein
LDKVLLRRNYIIRRPFAGFARRTLEEVYVCLLHLLSAEPTGGSLCASSLPSNKEGSSLWLFLLLVVLLGLFVVVVVGIAFAFR